MELEKFVETYPRLYHMAERDTWASIKRHGLLSTAAVLDRHGIKGTARRPFEVDHRPTKMSVGAGKDSIVLRDQKPMPPDRIAKALIDGTTPAQWYKFLNQKVFMWAEEERLLTLLGAMDYKNLEHDVLTIDTARLMAGYAERVSLCRMNSGNTKPFWLSRGLEDFKRIPDYPTKIRSGGPAKPVVEVVVDYAVPDISKYVIEVRRMKARQVLAGIPF
jgi:hypothetical protein